MILEISAVTHQMMSYILTKLNLIFLILIHNWKFRVIGIHRTAKTETIMIVVKLEGLEILREIELKSICTIIYVLYDQNNRYIFFSELSNSLNRAAMIYIFKYTLNKKKGNGNYFSDLLCYSSFSLKILMTDITCDKSINRSSTDVLLTDKIRSFHHCLFWVWP